MPTSQQPGTPGEPLPPTPPSDGPRTQLDMSVMHPARRYNYWLGGKDHFAPDRASGDAIAVAHPVVKAAALANRAFLGRAMRYVAGQGMRQFLDIGTGLPAPGNTHEIAQAVDPGCRTVYVDNDPLVLVHARALLTSTIPDTVAYLHADLADPAAILDYLRADTILDLTEPIGLLLVAVLHFLPDDIDPHRIVTALLDALAPGSFLVLSHGTADFLTAEQRAALPALAPGYHPRSRTGITAFTASLEPVAPGLVGVADWRPDTTPHADPDTTPNVEAGVRLGVEQLGVYGVVARKPAG
ncbi:SAM-dependent methyltransferase [Dactylosporangium sp. CA-152071]|uniref:SAM-dependent methyltransferase n=1 Tax=Dactylosporangium sp. CA-152071 TaxID=3239933 RepID=UPI003D8E1CE9